MYVYEPVEVFKRVMDTNHNERSAALQRNGERKVPAALANNLLENLSSQFIFPRPKKEIFAKKNYFPKTQVQEKILYKKPQFSLRNVVKHHGYSNQPTTTTYQQVETRGTPQRVSQVVQAPTVVSGHSRFLSDSAQHVQRGNIRSSSAVNLSYHQPVQAQAQQVQLAR